jgi:hypothetical protein
MQANESNFGCVGNRECVWGSSGNGLHVQKPAVGLRLSAVLLLCFLFLACAVAHAQWAPLAEDAGAAQRIAWWREARVGMFLHWGVYAIPGRGE